MIPPGENRAGPPIDRIPRPAPGDEGGAAADGTDARDPGRRISFTNLRMLPKMARASRWRGTVSIAAPAGQAAVRSGPSPPRNPFAASSSLRPIVCCSNVVLVHRARCWTHAPRLAALVGVDAQTASAARFSPAGSASAAKSIAGGSHFFATAAANFASSPVIFTAALSQPVVAPVRQAGVVALVCTHAKTFCVQPMSCFSRPASRLCVALVSAFPHCFDGFPLCGRCRARTAARRRGQAGDRWAGDGRQRGQELAGPGADLAVAALPQRGRAAEKTRGQRSSPVQTSSPKSVWHARRWSPRPRPSALRMIGQAEVSPRSFWPSTIFACALVSVAAAAFELLQAELPAFDETTALVALRLHAGESGVGARVERLQLAGQHLRARPA